MPRRVVVTGVGMVSPLGIGTEANWNGLVAGRSGVSTITRFDTTDYPVHIGGEVEGFNPEDWIEPKEVKKFDLFVHYALAASLMALENSGLVRSVRVAAGACGVWCAGGLSHLGAGCGGG